MTKVQRKRLERAKQHVEKLVEIIRKVTEAEQASFDKLSDDEREKEGGAGDAKLVLLNLLEDLDYYAADVKDRVESLIETWGLQERL